MKHKINHLSFGKRNHQNDIKNNYGKQSSDELNGVSVMNEPFRGGQLYVEYIIDITEAEYEDTTNYSHNGTHPLHSAFEYRSMKTVLTTHSMGAVWFKYEIAPLKVHYAMYR